MSVSVPQSGSSNYMKELTLLHDLRLCTKTQGLPGRNQIVRTIAGLFARKVSPGPCGLALVGMVTLITKATGSLVTMFAMEMRHLETNNTPKATKTIILHVLIVRDPDTFRRFVDPHFKKTSQDPSRVQDSQLSINQALPIRVNGHP
jgi:hypothetical protein